LFLNHIILPFFKLTSVTSIMEINKNRLVELIKLPK